MSTRATSDAAPTVDALPYKAELDAIAAAMPGPILQIGARRQVIDRSAENRRTWRERAADKGFVGADLEHGENVDAVFDICWPLDRIAAALLPSGQREFGGIVCAHLLEHVKDPFGAARNIAALLAPGGRVFIQVPWVQAFHAFPDDYWRISLSGLELLFEGLVPVDAFYSGGSSDVAYRITRGGRTDFSRRTREAEAELFQVLLPREASQRLLAQAGKRLHLSRGYLPVTVINFVAEKPA
ncbi:methyltransferase domain-containing protein [Limibaculum sp. M0105]|uniref:Methyltransferase domain-containing protein n=1 Tax=Thermohalobaculum xanthum TaxID=2753746 RepID=A0A8J7SDS1_9RHOB|nr:methyltransferase domain-containing protein [Thermohalobaculum xanthum]MBK0399403.1 methyltransferase domain-containing protein [Thermohalobaculum xanthum]